MLSQTYEILEQVGQGGMGVVYKARHKFLDKLVAIKKIRPQREDQQRTLDRFLREMKVLASLQHRNIVRIIHAGVEDGEHFFVMEYLQGQDLQRYVDGRSPLSLREACGMIGQAAQGWQAMHAKGLVHRDVKPGICFGPRRKWSRFSIWG